MIRPPWIGLWISLAGVLGCGDGPQGPPFQVRDSAGVEIVENVRSLWGLEPAWRIGSEPLLRIGVLEGDPAYQFDGVTGAARLEDGTVVVADFGYQNVRFFDPEGRIRSTFGGPGEGPGEFQGLSGMGVAPDLRIWMYDFMLRRITWLDGSGNLAGLTTLDPEPPMLNPIGVLGDGSFLLRQLWGATQVAEATEAGLRRDPVAFVRFDSGGTLLDTLCLLPGRELFLTDEDGRGVMSTPPFGKNASGATWGGSAVVGSTEALDLTLLGPGEETVRIVRVLGMDLSLDQEAREAYIRGRLALQPEEEQAAERTRLEAMAFPDSRPAFGPLLEDDGGNLWVGDWVLAPETPEAWKVFDSRGRWLGEVSLPPRFFPMDIGEDWVLGVERDELEVEFIVIYPLIKNRSDA